MHHDGCKPIPIVLYGGGVVFEHQRSRGMGWDKRGHTHPQDGDKPPVHPAPLCHPGRPAQRGAPESSSRENTTGIVIWGPFFPLWEAPRHLPKYPYNSSPEPPPRKFFRGFMECPVSPLPLEISAPSQTGEGPTSAGKSHHSRKEQMMLNKVKERFFLLRRKSFCICHKEMKSLKKI